MQLKTGQVAGLLGRIDRLKLGMHPENGVGQDRLVEGDDFKGFGGAPRPAQPKDKAKAGSQQDQSQGEAPEGPPPILASLGPGQKGKEIRFSGLFRAWLLKLPHSCSLS